ncbi:hypothetical protein JW756_02295 [Candidatus Woesearchaeota archaeon]|nr:hypothetical protein [Candidatus Woesearchaeota archaeon]
MKILNKWFSEWKQGWNYEFSKRKYALLLSLFLLIFANIISFYASKYVDSISSVAAPDLILDILPVLNLDLVFVWGFVIVVLTIFAYTIFFKPKEIRKVIFQFSLLILLRSFFITLTHLKQPVGARLISGFPVFYHFLSFRNDLFFSGHTAVPFLAFLLFRKEKIGVFFLIMSIILAITVLFTHIHYSIDVFAAFFITYGSYKIGEWACRKC